MPLHDRHPQWSGCRIMQSLSSSRHCTHHHKNTKILRVSRSFYVPNDHITDSVSDAQCLHFTTKVKLFQVDPCLLSQQHGVDYSYQ
ncbi:hypothetical protein PoB_005028600 [Plakobranchus ocellatus]|uniref:Uncharacterized protein n=1 Tax=Plakobranchus ocellatus TaxID=259542 RepID=A0AAV4BTJ0_9GAST|nr:hypothetical protein PoB_005028600 [Plakobranchus ocellatus]